MRGWRMMMPWSLLLLVVVALLVRSGMGEIQATPTSDRILLLLPAGDSNSNTAASRWKQDILAFASGPGGSVPRVRVAQGTGQLPDSLFTYGLPDYQSVVCAGCTALPKDMYAFLQEGGNLMVAVGPDMPAAIRELAYEFSVEFDDKATRVVDYAAGSAADPTLIQVRVPDQKHPIVQFRGIAHRLTRRNPLAHMWLAAPATAFSDLPDSTKPLGELAGAGSADVLLASALQTRNNSRIVFLGSALEEDLLAGDQGKGTVEFLRRTAAWVHGVAGRVRILSTHHHRVGETQQHGIYRIKDTLEFHAILATVAADGSLQPFAVDDLQLEVVMLDPYVRTTFVRDDRTNKVGPTTYTATFTLPDVHGVYTFKVNYRRHGISWLTHTETVQVRPFRHNQYPRFLTQAYPYYAGVFSQFAAFLVFAALWMYHREAPSQGERAAEKVALGKTA